MQRLYCPWRAIYFNNSSIVHHTNNCPFCTYFSQTEDQKNFILKRGLFNAIILNLYPYNNGHLLIVPFQHTPSLIELSIHARGELIELSTIASEILKQEFNCEGINIGLNISKAAGGSIPEHVHTHVVPRWIGDTNFLATIADCKPLPFDLNQTYDRLKKYFID